MTMEFALAAGCVTLAIGHMVAFAGIWFRYAIPRSPRIFHYILFLTMTASGVTLMCIAWLALTYPDVYLFGYFRDVYWIVFFFSEAATIWTLNAYALYFHLRGRRCPA